VTERSPALLSTFCSRRGKTSTVRAGACKAFQKLNEEGSFFLDQAAWIGICGYRTSRAAFANLDNDSAVHDEHRKPVRAESRPEARSAEIQLSTDGLGEGAVRISVEAELGIVAIGSSQETKSEFAEGERRSSL